MKKAAKFSVGVLSVSLLILAGAVGYKVYKSNQGKPPSLAQLAKLQYQSPQITTNAGNGLVQLQVTIQAENKKTFNDLTSAQTEISDLINNTARTEYEGLNTPDGMNQFKAAILNGTRKLLPGDDVQAVYLDQLLVQ